MCKHSVTKGSYGVSINGQVLPVTNGTAASLDNDQFTNHIAGMSKQQLNDVMMQMKVRSF